MYSFVKCCRLTKNNKSITTEILSRMREIDDRWPSDVMQANVEVKDRFIELLEALWLFLTAFSLWVLRTASPQLWKALQAIWAGILAIRWGLPQMWRELTIGGSVSSLDAYREKVLAASPILDRAPMDFSTDDLVEERER